MQDPDGLPGPGCGRGERGPARRAAGEPGELYQASGELEEITSSNPGVEKSYAIQAGREVRVMVRPEQVSEDQMVILARDLAKRIEDELEYPGQIKVHLIRETKVVEYAK